MNTDTDLRHLEAALRELEPKVKAQCDMNAQQTMTFAITSLVSLRTSLCLRSERAVSDGVSLIAAERKRQVEKEGWDATHDDTHVRGEMAITAACYAVEGTAAVVTVDGCEAWPWGSCDDKRNWHGPVRRLVIAGALIAAEIDRLSRADRLVPSPEGSDKPSFMSREWCMAMARAEESSAVRALITRGKSALENWGRHHPWCEYTNTPPASCNCGLARELAALVVPSPGDKGSDNG